MNPRCTLIVVALGAGCALPLLNPIVVLLRFPAGWWALGEFGRFTSLFITSSLLACGAIALAVPLGTLTALGLERGPLARGRVIPCVLVIGMLTPLPVYAAAWQAALGATVLANGGNWKPWQEGLLPAIWVHGLAGMPWVVWIASQAIRATDSRLEDDALLAGGTAAVFRWVVWPRMYSGVIVAACWLGVQALTEVVITDVLMVRTFAEEVYFQTVGNPAGVAAAVAIQLPVWMVCILSVWVRGQRLKSFGLLSIADSSPRTVPNPICWYRKLVVAGLGAGVVVLVGWPICALVIQIGSFRTMAHVTLVHGPTLLDSLFWALVAGLLATSLALGASWYARRSQRLTRLLLMLTGVIWVTPAPLIGLGLKQAIEIILDFEELLLNTFVLLLGSPPFRSLLYDEPSPVPAIWAMGVRYFPIAVVMMWSLVRRIPQELVDMAALDGGRSPLWCGVIWPTTRAAVLRTALVVGLLGFGEVIASKLVQPPGRQSFAQEQFHAMHYGSDATVAAMCLLQLITMTIGSIVLVMGSSYGRRGP